MSPTATLEARVTSIEKDIAELKDRVFRSDRARPWYETMVGSTKDFPEFDEVVKLGREIRKADAIS